MTTLTTSLVTALRTFVDQVISAVTLVTLHNLTVTVLWILLAAKTLTASSMSMAFSLALEVRPHIGSSKKDMATMFSFSFGAVASFAAFDSAAVAVGTESFSHIRTVPARVPNPVADKTVSIEMVTLF